LVFCLCTYFEVWEFKISSARQPTGTIASNREWSISKKWLSNCQVARKAIEERDGSATSKATESNGQSARRQASKYNGQAASEGAVSLD